MYSVDNLTSTHCELYENIINCGSNEALYIKMGLIITMISLEMNIIETVISKDRFKIGLQKLTSFY